MSDPKDTILIVDDDAEYREALTGALEREFVVTLAASFEEAKMKLNKGLSAVLLDVRLKDESTANKDGLILLEAIRQMQPGLPVVMMTNYGDIDMAVDAWRLGAADFIQKARMDIREFRKVLKNAIELSTLKRNFTSLKEDYQRYEPWEMVGDDPKIQAVRDLIDRVAQDGYSTVLVRGETGTGKELVARAVHLRGWRSKAPFVPLPSLSRELIESQLFGYAKGAFTDAKQTNIGYLEKAHGGVLFLDEIGELPPDMQVKLLRFLETRTFARVGSTQEITVDIQVVAATNRDLEVAVKEKQFREDLYFRLKSIDIRLPPLRERPDDIGLISEHFLSLLRQQGRTKMTGISPAAIELLKKYSFPGNVRELKTCIESAMMGNEKETLLEPSDLPLEVQQSSVPQSDSIRLPVGENGIDLDSELARVELAYIQEALQFTEGKKTEAWRLLGLNDRFALRRRVKRIGEVYPHLINSFSLVQRLYYE
jgi:DNA-binding NtrC family response regulator